MTRFYLGSDDLYTDDFGEYLCKSDATDSRPVIVSPCSCSNESLCSLFRVGNQVFRTRTRTRTGTDLHQPREQYLFKAMAEGTFSEFNQYCEVLEPQPEVSASERRLSID